MPHLIRRNTTSAATSGDIATTLARAQRGSGLHDHAGLARDISARVTGKRSLPRGVAQSVERCAADVLANEARLALRAPSSLPDNKTREALLRGLAEEKLLLARFTDAIAGMMATLLDEVEWPEPTGWATLTIDVPLVTRIKEPAVAIKRVIETALRFAPDATADEPRLGIGFAFAGEVMKRLLKVSALTETEARARPHRLRWPEGDGALTLVETYLAGTALEPLLRAPVRLQVGDAHLMEHALVVAGSGAGKSQLLEMLIARHLERPDAERCGLVVIDSQGDLLRHVMRHRGCRDRLVYVDPSDVVHPPALNLFGLGKHRNDDTDPRAREATRNAILELYEYVLGDLLLSDMSSKMLVPFRFLNALLHEVEGATLQDLRRVLEDIAPYREAVQRLGPTAQRFFERDYQEKTFSDTRKQLAWRLDGLLVNTAFERMFAASESRLDLFTALDQGKIVLCNTAKDFLRAEASSIFGRYHVAATLAAVLDRARQPEHQRRPAFLIIDEAQEYFSGSLDTLLRQARKYRLGVMLATQTISSMSPSLRDSLMANTGIKIASAISDRGAETLAANMRTSSAFIHAQVKTREAGRFAIHVRNLTREAVSLTVPFGVLSRAPQLSDGELATLLDRNARALSAPTRPRDKPDTADADGNDDTPRRGRSRRNALGRGGARGDAHDDGWESY